MSKSPSFKKQIEPYHIVYYVENCTPGMRKFTSLKDMKTFLKEFNARYPKDYDSGGTFIDFYVTNITGEVKFL